LAEVDLDQLTPLLGAATSSTLEGYSILVTGEPLVLTVRSPVSTQDAVVLATNLRRLANVSVLVADPAQIPTALSDTADICLSTVAAPPAPWVDSSLDQVRDAITAQPLAALALVALLRTAVDLGVWDAVAAESSTYAMLLGSDAHRRWLEQRGAATPKHTGRPAVVLTRDGAALRLELDRPEARNAFDRSLRDDLVDGLAVAAADPSITTVTISGRGPAFSGGGDLDEFGTVADGATALAVRLTRHPGMAVHEVAERTSVHLHGACVGAGIEVPAVAARVLADADTSISLPELSMGLIPGAGGTVSITRRIGRQRTAWLAITGATIDASTAHSWGLVDEMT
jgi:hypothetical protein